MSNRDIDLSPNDAAVFGDVLPNDVAIRNYLQPLRAHLASAGATELWINRPGELMIQVGPDTRVVSEPRLHYAALDALAQAVAVYSQQPGFGSEHPILSATLPDGERIQIVLPPAVEPGRISLTVRIPGSTVRRLEDYEDEGAFDDFAWAHPQEDLGAGLAALGTEDARLAKCLACRDLRGFLVAAVQGKKNIAVVGDTGSGKTTLMKSMCQHIPADERLITIEDVRELLLPHHANRVHLLYSKGGHGVSKVTPSDLIASCMRMTPTRVLPAELRGLEAWDFLKLLTTGHTGAITSFHAESCALAFERFMFMVKENQEAASLGPEEVKHLVRLTLDVVIHVRREVVHDASGQPTGVRRHVDEVHFDPWAKHAARYGAARVERAPTATGAASRSALASSAHDHIG
jgi:type IV secretion system protein VirB11